MIEIKQTLTEEDYRKAVNAVYSTYKIAKIRPVLGLLLVASGIYLFFVKSSMILFALLAVLYGIFMFFRKAIYTWQMVNGVKTSKLFGEPIEVAIDDHGILDSKSGSCASKINLKDLYGYQDEDFAVILYSQKNIFLELKKDSFATSEQIDELIALLDKFDVKNIKKMKK